MHSRTRHSPGRRARSPGPAPISTWMRPKACRSPWIATVRRSSSTRRPGPTSTVAPATRGSRCDGTARRPGCWLGPARSAAWTSSSSPRTRCSTGTGPMARATAPTTSPPRQTRTARPSWSVNGRRRAPMRVVAEASASPGRRGCSDRPATTSRARSWMRRSGPRRPASRCASSVTNGGAPTYAADVAEAICELLADDALAGRHHLVNGGVATRAEWAADVLTRLGVATPVAAVPADTWTRASTPPRWGVLAADPAAERGTHPSVDAGHGRLRARASPRAWLAR